jgi:proteasome alpha subunit
MPFYMSPEQLVRDRSEYARKGIARGRSVLALTYSDGILFVAENISSALHKVSEIYDRIAFAAVGKYNEFENLRVAGVRVADMRGYAYDRRDVTGRALANVYAQTLGAIFLEHNKPYEVEIVVAEVGDVPANDQMYRLTYDGSVADERGFVAMGGQADAITAYLREQHRDGLSLRDAMQVALGGLRAPSANGDADRPLNASNLEVAVLDRTRPRRAFKRIVGPALNRLLGAEPPGPVPAGTDGEADAGEGSAAGGGSGASESLEGIPPDLPRES